MQYRHTLPEIIQQVWGNSKKIIYLSILQCLSTKIYHSEVTCIRENHLCADLKARLKSRCSVKEKKSFVKTVEKSEYLVNKIPISHIFSSKENRLDSGSPYELCYSLQVR